MHINEQLDALNLEIVRLRSELTEKDRVIAEKEQQIKTLEDALATKTGSQKPQKAPKHTLNESKES